MAPTVDYLNDMESSFDVVDVPLDNIVNFYSSGAYRKPEIHTRHSRARQEPEGKSAGVHAMEHPSSSTYASQARKFTNLKDNLSATSRNPCAKILKKIYPRVEYLHKIALEEQEQEPLSSDSYLGLVNFLNGIYDLNSIPVLGLTYEGNILAEWRRSHNEKLVLQFLDSFNLRFVFFYTDFYNPDNILRISGNASVLSFFEDHPRTLRFLKEFSD